MSYVNKRGYTCRSAAEKLALVAEYKESGESQSLFCARKSIPDTTFYSWLSIERKLDAKVVAERATKQGKFISVRTPQSITAPERDDLSDNYFVLNFRLGSVLNLEYRRSFKCRTV